MFYQSIINGSSGSNTLRGDARGNIIKAGAGNDQVFGNGGRDELNGEAGDDTLYGGEDNDILNGGAGDDILDGGPGVDTFVFEPGDEPGDEDEHDYIMDFNTDGVTANADRIDLTAFDGINSTGDVTRSNDADGNAVIDLTSQGGGMITLLGIDQNDLGGGDFIFS